MPYDPQLNTASRAVIGQGPATMPLMSNAVRQPNPAMTSPMAGASAPGSNPLVPGLGAPQGSVAPGGPQSGAFAGSPNMALDPSLMQETSQMGGPQSFGQGPQGAFSSLSNSVAMPRGVGAVGMSQAGRGAFGAAPGTGGMRGGAR
jgi:hypothetical protein